MQSKSPVQKSPDLNIFISGTDTEVGKSVVSLLTMQCLISSGHNPYFLKPLQTGCNHPRDSESDAAFVYRFCPGLQNQDSSASICYCYPQPKAPWWASRNLDGEIDLNYISERLETLQANYSPLVAEGAGGLYVPITKDHLMIDLIKRAGFSVVLVARAGLGTINHSLLSIAALRAYSIPILGLVLVDNSEVSTDEKMLQENIESIERFGKISIYGIIGKINEFISPPQYCLDIIENLLRQNKCRI